MSIRRLDLNISELESWVKENKNKKEFKYFDLSQINKKIRTLKIKNNILLGYKIKAIQELIKIPIKLNNFKYFPFIFLPNKVIKKLFSL